MTDHTLHIDDMGRRGEGIAHQDGRAIFIPGTLPGETVRAAGDGERLALGEILEASPDRESPFCKHYGRCGGCQLQHWKEESYRNWKMSLVEQALSARGLEAKVSGIIDAHGTGRRRVALHVRRRDGGVTAGYMEARSHRLLDIDTCPILEPALDRAFDIGRLIGVRLGDCDVALTSTLTGLDVSVKAERKFFAQEHANLASLVSELRIARLSVNGEVIATAVTPRIATGCAEVALPPGGFLQATAEGEAVLARLVQDGVGKSKSVADLFCGTGPFAFRLAERGKVEAYDSDRAAIAALQSAVKSTPGLKPLVAAARDLFREPLVPNEMKGFDAVVFDPPRAGAEAQAKQLARSAVNTVVAVSCDASSFARDAEILVGGGYALKQVTAVDQFKWSSHVETVAVFRRER
ncbi:class I SAM-dependent RNA methyltransferase [Aestuariivirga sp.]|uniref:class I SAM-dependent RNA methyltransferase n=1 Tax=Aestuariivirga sp. TaxID=2650926 RepID=UPI0035934C72